MTVPNPESIIPPPSAWKTDSTQRTLKSIGGIASLRALSTETASVNPGAVFVLVVQKVKTVGDWTRSPRGIRYTLLHLQIPGNVTPDNPASPEGPVTGTRADSTG